MVIVYAIAGLVPMKMWSDTPGGGHFAIKWLSLWHTRRIPDGATIHASVQARKEKLGYNPSNLKAAKDPIYVENLKQ